MTLLEDKQTAAVAGHVVAAPTPSADRESAARPVRPLARWAARTILQAAQRTPLRGSGGYSEAAFQARGDRREFPQAQREAINFHEFFGYFEQYDFYSELLDRVVLDFGSGYGGRTVQYAQLCAPRFVWGVEPVERHVSQSIAFAAACGAENCGFRLCSQSNIPLEDETVDVVLSYDVLEHVADPRVSLAELWRVLRPGGTAFLVFPVYDGVLSHHLDYIARVPALHWLFRPETLVAAINDLVSRHGIERWGTPEQPMPGWSFDRSRRVLPSLNGMTGQQFQQAIGAFEVELLRFNLHYARRKWRGRIVRWLARRGASGRLRDALTSSVAAVLRKPGAGRLSSPAAEQATGRV